MTRGNEGGGSRECGGDKKKHVRKLICGLGGNITPKGKEVPFRGGRFKKRSSPSRSREKSIKEG